MHTHTHSKDVQAPGHIRSIVLAPLPQPISKDAAAHLHRQVILITHARVAAEGSCVDGSGRAADGKATWACGLKRPTNASPCILFIGLGRVPRS